jgi:hypothetical protein
MTRAQTNDGRDSRARDDRWFLAGLIGLLMTVMWVLPAAADETPIFTEDQKILASDGAAGDNFGLIGPSGIHGDKFIIGAPRFDGPGGTDSGAAYIFGFDGSEWVEEAKLYPTDGTFEGYFGWNVMIYDDFAAVSATEDADPSHIYGAVYIYRYNGSAWVFEQKIIGDDDSKSAFGISLAAHDNLIFIGDTDDYIVYPFASGAVSIYRYINGVWVFEQKVYGKQVQNSHDAAWSIASDGDRLFIGQNDYGEPQPGEYNWVSIHKYDGIEWVLEADLSDYDLAADAPYGRAVDIQGPVAVVGCVDDTTLTYRGAVYVYRFSGAPDNEWAEETVLVPSDVQNNDYFGEQVVLADENTIVVQALHHDIDGYGRSTLYIYRYRDEEWTLTSRFTPSDPGDGFGQLSSSSLAAEGGKIVTGAALDDQIGSNAGAAFYFDIGCDGDIDGDGDVDLSDLGALLASFELEPGDPWFDPRADVDGDGDVDLSDLGALLAAYELPCP